VSHQCPSTCATILFDRSRHHTEAIDVRFPFHEIDVLKMGREKSGIPHVPLVDRLWL
jgi:hypothetical protein